MNKKALITILVVSLGINVGLFGMVLYRGIAKTDSDRFGPKFRSPDTRSERHLPGRPGSGPPALPKWFERECKLSDEQKENINKIFTESNEKLDVDRKTIEDKRKELFTLINRREPNLDEIDKKITEISVLELEIEKMFVRKIISVRKVLTPDQVKLLDSHIEKYMRPSGKGSPGFRGNHGHRKGSGDKGSRWGGGKNKANKWGDYESQGKQPQSEENESDENEIGGGETEDIEK